MTSGPEKANVTRQFPLTLTAQVPRLVQGVQTESRQPEIPGFSRDVQSTEDQP